MAPVLGFVGWALIFSPEGCQSLVGRPQSVIAQQTRNGVLRQGASLSPEQLAFANDAAPSLVKEVVMQYSSLGMSIRKANGMSGGAAKLKEATLLDVTSERTTVECTVERRRGFGRIEQEVQVAELEWSAIGIAESSALENRLVSLACSLQLGGEAAKLMTMPGGEGQVGSPADDMWLNNVPARREARAHFATQATESLIDALSTNGTRFSMTLRPPELDDELDTYRVGTLLELARSLALSVIAKLGLRVRVCVQGPMGSGTFQGVPLSLNGVRRLLVGMDWGESSSELFENEFIRFGDVSKDAVDDKDDVFIILAPQSLVGCSVVDALRDMCEAVGDRPIVLVNPKLQDVASPQGVMSVRGRADRLEFARSFSEIYKFRLIVPRGRAFFPILGAVVKAGLHRPYVLFARQEVSRDPEATYADSVAKFRAVQSGDLRETYVAVAAYSDLPEDSKIATALRAHNAGLAASRAAAS